MTPKATSNTQLDNIIEKTNRAGDAILNIAKIMQSVSGADLNLGNASDEVKELLNNINELQERIDSSINTGFQKFLTGSSQSAAQLRETFSGLGQELKDVNADNAFEILSKGLEKATKNAENARNAVTALNNDIKVKTEANAKKYEGNPLFKDFDQTAFEVKIKDIKLPDKILNPEKVEAAKASMKA